MEATAPVPTPAPAPTAVPISRGPGLLGSGDPRARLIVLSFLMLFVELALIRWTGSNIMYLSYFSNFVLLGSFLGIGVGFLRAHSKRNLFALAPVVLAALVLYVNRFPVRIDRTDTSASGLIFFGEYAKTGLPIHVTLPIIFLAVALVMALIAQGVAQQFSEFRPLEAYRLDIIGSILGIVAFSLLSFADAPPVWWGVVAGFAFLWLLVKRTSRLATAAAAISILVMVSTLAVESSEGDARWSPYYKVTTMRYSATTVDVFVNGIPHQRIQTTDDRQAQEPWYFLPYQHRNTTVPPANVLIVGAGTGSDVAIALRQGAGHVDAVEIDPQLQRLGEQLHPDHPYDDPRVRVIINDGRAFLEQTDQKYDLILFALPDSLTLVSGQSSLRLESYLFTREAMQTARDHLNPRGAFAMYNYYRESWLVDRLANTLNEVYGHAPCADVFGGSVAVLENSVEPDALTCPTRWTQLATPLSPPASDNRPFLYLRHNVIPGFYLTTIGLILVASLVVVRAAGGPFRPMKGYLDLFFMGAAFLLLETKSVVQFALLFGTTWFVNALVFGGILLSVLAAIEVSRRYRIGRPAIVYGMLILALGVAYLVPTASLVQLPTWARFLAGTSLAFAPVFLANLVFAERFRNTGNSRTAFGANLLGAMVGGLLEYSSLVIGYQTLLLVVAALYGCAFLAGRVHLAPQGRFIQAAAPE